MTPATPAIRYTAVAIALHWAIAAAIACNLALGWWMHGAIEVLDTQARAVTAFQLHKSLGLTILLLSLLRLAWRWTHPPPPLPPVMPAWEKLAARATHWTFYALMIGIPLSGWLYVSTQWRGDAPLNIPTLWFGLFEVPHLFGLNQIARELRQEYAYLTLYAHWLLAWSMGLLLVLHVAAALKHHFINRDGVLAQMIPALQDEPVPHARGRKMILAAAFTIIIAVVAALAFALLRTPTGTVAQSSAGAISSASGGWIIDPQQSEISFSGTHAGAAFRGTFTRWSADLRINPAGITQSQISARIETASATDGVPLHDETLPQAEWFDVSRHPYASFHATQIRALGGARYEIDGTLQIKGHTLALTPLNLDIENDRARISGRVEISRRDADLGLESDPNAEWVSAAIIVEVNVATRRP